MTPPDVWTSEPPSEPGWYWLKLRHESNARVCHLDAPTCWMDGDRRSAHRIASAERAAALEELASIVVSMFTVTDATSGRVTQDNSQLVPLLAAISRLEACRG